MLIAFIEASPVAEAASVAIVLGRSRGAPHAFPRKLIASPRCDSGRIQSRDEFGRDGDVHSLRPFEDDWRDGRFRRHLDSDLQRSRWQGRLGQGSLAVSGRNTGWEERHTRPRFKHADAPTPGNEVGNWQGWEYSAPALITWNWRVGLLLVVGHGVLRSADETRIAASSLQVLLASGRARSIIKQPGPSAQGR